MNPTRPGSSPSSRQHRVQRRRVADDEPLGRVAQGQVDQRGHVPRGGQQVGHQPEYRAATAPRPAAGEAPPAPRPRTPPGSAPALPARRPGRGRRAAGPRAAPRGRAASRRPAAAGRRAAARWSASACRASASRCRRSASACDRSASSRSSASCRPCVCSASALLAGPGPGGAGPPGPGSPRRRCAAAPPGRPVRTAARGRPAPARVSSAIRSPSRQRPRRPPPRRARARRRPAGIPASSSPATRAASVSTAAPGGRVRPAVGRAAAAPSPARRPGPRSALTAASPGGDLLAGVGQPRLLVPQRVLGPAQPPSRACGASCSPASAFAVASATSARSPPSTASSAASAAESARYSRSPDRHPQFAEPGRVLLVRWAFAAWSRRVRSCLSSSCRMSRRGSRLLLDPLELAERLDLLRLEPADPGRLLEDLPPVLRGRLRAARPPGPVR